MHRGKAYHDFMLASPGDIGIRARFQHLVYQFTPYHGSILDFGAGTGIDAKAYAGKNFSVLVCEPCEENRAYLTAHCRGELEEGKIAVADLTANETVHVIAADFAVLNLIADHRALFAMFGCLLAPEGYVIASLLNPFFAGDVCYAWWRRNLRALMRNGFYAVEGKDGPVYRFTPAAVARAAEPGFSWMALRPAPLGLAVSRYMFMVFRKKKCP